MIGFWSIRLTQWGLITLDKLKKMYRKSNRHRSYNPLKKLPGKLAVGGM
jgi:hypothetical protein